MQAQQNTHCGSFLRLLLLHHAHGLFKFISVAGEISVRAGNGIRKGQ